MRKAKDVRHVARKVTRREKEDEGEAFVENALISLLSPGLCEQPHPPSPRRAPDSLPVTKGREEEGEEGEWRSDSEEEEEKEDDDLLAQSMEDEVGNLLRSTVQELETALEVR